MSSENHATHHTYLLSEIKQCRYCETVQSPLPHAARPIIRGNPTACVRIIGQAPGTRVHASGIPFDDPSGERLRAWLGVTRAQFYDEDLFAITPMGFCFPGLDDAGSDLPPRKECATLWHEKINAIYTNAKLTLLVGMYAQKHYLGNSKRRTLTETVKHWRDYGPDIIPLPHPSWRNNGWLKKYTWFDEVITHLQLRITEVID